MRIVFGSLKYCFKNLWYILPFAIVPGILLAFCLDYNSISAIVSDFFAGKPPADFLLIFYSLSLFHPNVWGIVFFVSAFIACAVFMALMLSLVEKHMRIGKRTGSGAFSQFFNLLAFSFGITLLYLVLFEIWAVVVSAVMFAVSAVKSVPTIYALDVMCFIFLTLILIYVMTVFYLWFPCKQITGLKNHDSLAYSYRLVTGVRGRLILSILISMAVGFVLIAGLSLLPQYVFYIVASLFVMLVFLNFGVRMETVYFATDKIDREDLIRSYREL